MNIFAAFLLLGVFAVHVFANDMAVHEAESEDLLDEVFVNAPSGIPDYVVPCKSNATTCTANAEGDYCKKYKCYYDKWECIFDARPKPWSPFSPEQNRCQDILTRCWKGVQAEPGCKQKPPNENCCLRQLQCFLAQGENRRSCAIKLCTGLNDMTTSACNYLMPPLTE